MITGDAGVSTIAHTQLQVDGMEREWRAGTLLALPGVKLFFPCLLRPRVEELISQSCTGYRGGCTCVSPSLVIRPRPNRAQSSARLHSTISNSIQNIRHTRPALARGECIPAIGFGSNLKHIAFSGGNATKCASVKWRMPIRCGSDQEQMTQMAGWRIMSSGTIRDYLEVIGTILPCTAHTAATYTGF